LSRRARSGRPFTAYERTESRDLDGRIVLIPG
jgi:hypothetical protein